MTRKELTKKAIQLLQSLIAIPSFSSQEDKTAECIEEWFKIFGIASHRRDNNVFAYNKHFDPGKPTLLLNSHHDTVKPNVAYTRDPFDPKIENNKLYGLGSNDAGGCLVSLLAAFTCFYKEKDLSHNIILVASAEEENSGKKGLGSVLSHLPQIDVAMVGEPTQMNLAIAEKGLVVFDAVVKGTPGHAAHSNEDNSIYNAIPVLKWFENYKFEKVSDTLGEVKMTVSQINAGNQHNVIPAETHLAVDVRVNDCYSNKEIAEILQNKCPCDSIAPRSLRLNSSAIPIHHKLVQSGIELGMKTYGSPTLSDQSVLNCPSLKLGPGDSTRSHSADEFIYLHEIEDGITDYIKILKNFLILPPN